MNQFVYKIVTLKEFADFAFSLKEMQEVKENNFPVPTTISYNLNKRDHEALQKEILKEKKLPIVNLGSEFELELYDIVFKFTK